VRSLRLRLLVVAVLSIVLALSSAPNAFSAGGVAIIQFTLSPACGPPGTVVSFLGTGFGDSEHDPTISSSPDGLISDAKITITYGVFNSVISGTFIVAAGAGGSYVVTVHTLGIGQSVSAEFNTVCPQICVTRLGVQQPNGTVSSLPGYGYPDIPISQCGNVTDVLGQDVLGRTIVLHQFILNMTFTETVTIAVP